MNPNAFSPNPSNPIDPNRLPGAMPFDENNQFNKPFEPEVAPGIAQGHAPTSLASMSTSSYGTPASQDAWKTATPSQTPSPTPAPASYMPAPSPMPTQSVYAAPIPPVAPIAPVAPAQSTKPFIAPSVLDEQHNASTSADPVEADINRRKRVMFRILGLLAFLIILFIAMVGTLFFIPRIIGFFSNLSFSSKTATTDTKVVVTPDKSLIASGETVLLSWNGKLYTNGVYFVQHPCKEGLTSTFHSGEAVTCDQPFFFTTTDNTVALTFTNNTNERIDLPVYIRYRATDESTTVIGDTVVSINAKGVAVTNEPTTKGGNPIANFVRSITDNNDTKKNEPTTGSNNNTSGTTGTSGTKKPTTTTVANGADFTVQLIEIGSMNANNVFTSGNYVPAGDRGAIRFKVTNIGNRTSATWSFKAALPSDTNPIYQSPTQVALKAGESQDFTLGFPARIGGGSVVVEINADRKATERAYTNNILNFTFGTTNNGSTQTPVGNKIYGKDLVIGTIETGRVSNGVFTPAGQFDKTELVSIRFKVTNNGIEATGNWNFTATLPAPSSSDQTYTSATFSGLASGESREYVLTFTGVKDSGNNTVTVVVDPSNMVAESLENNNRSSSIIVGR